MVLTELLWLAATNQFFRPTLVFGCGVFFVFLAAFGPTMLWGFWVNIRFWWCCGWRFRPYGEALFPDAEKVLKKASP